MKINFEKTKFLRLNTTSKKNVLVDEHDIKDVESFVYLGAGGTEEDMKARAAYSYSKLDLIWKNSQETMIKIFKSNAIPVLLYGCGC